MSAVRVGMFTDSYLPRVSGAVRSVYATTVELRRLEHEVWVFAPRHPGAPADPHLVAVPSLHLRRYPDFPFAIPVAPRFLARVRDLHLDVVHAHSPFLMGQAAAFLAGRTGAPLVFTHHTLYVEYLHYVPVVSSTVTRPLVEWYVTAYANRCACVIAPSAAVREMLREHGVTSRIEVVPGAGPDPDAVARLDPVGVRGRFGLPEDEPLVFTVARLAPEKSVDLVIEAFARIRAAVPARLLIAGEGPSRPSLESLAAALGVGDRVVFAGMLSRDEVLSCARAADLFLFASRTETQGLVVVEAMAAGLPVVAVAAGGVAEVVPGDAGSLAAPDPRSLADAALRYLRDPALRRTAGERGRAAASQYTVGPLTQHLLDIYRSTLPAPSPAPAGR